MSMIRTNKSHKRSLTPWLLVALIFFALAGGALWWWHHHSTTTPVKVPINNHKTAIANPNVPSGSSTGNPTTGSGASKDQASNIPGPSLDPGVKPAAPSGEFVSNHSPNLSGSPAPNTETSTCTTTPGAQCQIRFTMGSVVKSLPTEKTDENGNVVWTTWTLQSIGLTKGTWHITAVAINGNDTATTQDATNLTVGP